MMIATKLDALTEREAQMLDAICALIDENDRSPTLRDLADHLNLGNSLRWVRELVLKLETAGIVVTAEGARSVRPLFYRDGRPFLRRGDLLARVSELELALSRRSA